MQKKLFQTMLVIIQCDSFTFYQFFLSPHVKQIVIFSNKNVIYDLPNKMLNGLTSWDIRKYYEDPKIHRIIALMPSLLLKIKLLARRQKNCSKI